MSCPSPVVREVAGWLPAASEFPNVVRLLADLRCKAVLSFPSPTDPVLTGEQSSAVDRSAELIRLTFGLGWDREVADLMTGRAVPA